MTDIDNLRLLAAKRAFDDPMGAYALDGCADEIERLRALVLIVDVRCEQCAAPATTLDMGEFASCVDCATKAKEL